MYKSKKRKKLLNRFDDYFQSSQTHNYPTNDVLNDNYIATRFNKLSSERLMRYVG